jgi:hypothetical protein
VEENLGEKADKQKPIWIEPESEQVGGRGTNARCSENQWRKQIGEALGAPAGDTDRDRREDLLTGEENQRHDRSPCIETPDEH